MVNTDDVQFVLVSTATALLYMVATLLRFMVKLYCV